MLYEGIWLLKIPRLKIRMLGYVKTDFTIPKCTHYNKFFKNSSYLSIFLNPIPKEGSLNITFRGGNEILHQSGYLNNYKC